MHFLLRRTALALSLLAMLYAPSPARGQANASLPAPGVQQVGLLINPGVQKELKLDSGQVEVARVLAVRVRDRMSQAYQGMQNQEIAERFRKLDEVNRELASEIRTALPKLLNKEQLRRLRQVSLQDRGGLSFGDPEVLDALKMSDGQKARVTSFVNQAFDEMRAAVQAKAADAAEALAKAHAIRKRLLDRVVSEMTDDQKQAWADMLGPPLFAEFGARPK
jgi:hypothetical protein